MDYYELRLRLAGEASRAHRKWEIARAIGATRETKNILAALADSRGAAYDRAGKYRPTGVER